MAKEVIIELKAKTDKIEQDVEGINKEIKTLNKNVDKTAEGFEGVEKASQDTAKGVKKIGTTLKAIGIGLLLAAFTKLKEVFQENQKVTDAFNTTFNFLSIAFNDFFNFIDANIGTVVGFFKSIFEDPKQSVIDFATTIKDFLLGRVQMALDGFGLLGQAIKKVFQGDFSGALETAVEGASLLNRGLNPLAIAGEKIAEVFPKVTKSITEYTKSTFNSAKAQTEANKAAEIAVARNRVILEQKDREAELLRQIRDDDLRTIDERIEANNKLGEVLAEQEKLMLANADALILAAELQLKKNNNDANQIALLEAKAEKEAVLAQITGFRSEQLANENALLRESVEIEQEVADAKAAIQDAALNNAMSGFQLLGKLAGKNRGLQAAAIIGENAAGIARQVINTRAANAKVTAKYALLPGGAALAAAEKAINNVSLGIGVASSVLATSQALKALKAGGSASKPSVGGNEPTPSQAPAFNIVGATGSNQLADAIAGQSQQPVRAFVVSNDVTSAQELDRNIIEGASIG
tara:strand:- start:232 stop:1800 length:1569 start_codon:yes stop_codon:yes gene_type:complete